MLVHKLFTIQYARVRSLTIVSQNIFASNVPDAKDMVSFLICEANDDSVQALHD